MSEPVFQAVGTAVKAHNKALSPSWPTHEPLDVAFLFVEASGSDTITLSIANGFVEVPGSPFNTGSTQLAVFWCRATSVAMPNPTIADPGNHGYAVIATARGCIQAGDPWDAVGGGVKSTASTALSIASLTTTLDDTLVLMACTKNLDAVAAFASSPVNASLTGLTERFDAGTTLGDGGGIAIFDGVKATAGATGTTAITVTSSENAYFAVALKSPISVEVALTGNSVSVAGGQLVDFVGHANVTLDAGVATAQGGSPVIAGSAPVTLTGQELASAAGEVEVLTSITVAIAGVEATATPGTLAMTGNGAVTLTGNAVTATGSGAEAVSAGTAALAGASITAAPGTVTASSEVTVALEGASCTTAVGSVTVSGSQDATASLAGASLTVAAGEVIATANVAVSLSGAAITATPGEVTAAGTGAPVSVNVNATGNSATVSGGTATVVLPIAETDRQILQLVTRRPVLEIVDEVRHARMRG